MKINTNKPLANYIKATNDTKAMRHNTTKPSWKVITTLLGIIVFIVGSISVVLITRKQDTTPVAPNVPQSQPAAYIAKEKTCTMSFEVPSVEDKTLSCGESSCFSDEDCEVDLICAQTDTTVAEKCADLGGNFVALGGCVALADNSINRNFCNQVGGIITTHGEQIDCEMQDGVSNDSLIGYCSEEIYEEACIANPSFTSCCETQDQEELSCGEVGCETNDDCKDGLICVETDNGNSYCSEEEFEDACIDDPSEESCCEAPITTTTTTTTTVTATTTATVTQPTATTTAGVTTVITTVGCNDTCSANADCSNVSHICYEGRCRLDVNPTDAQCRLPSGGTTISRPVVVPTQSGPADWINYLKAGLGVLGIGGLLLLLL